MVAADVGFVGVLAISGVLIAQQSFPSPTRLVAVLSLLVLGTVVQLPLRVGERKVAATGTFEAGLTLSLALAPAPWVLLFVTLVYGARLWHMGRPWERVLFGVSVTVVPAAVAATCFHAARGAVPGPGGAMLAIALGALCQVVLNELAVTAVVSAASREPFLPNVRSDAPTTLGACAANIALAWAVFLEVRYQHWEVLALIPPVLVVGVRQYRHWLARQTEADALARLETAATSVAALDEERAVREIVDRAAELFAARQIELVLLDWPGVGTQMHQRTAPGMVVTTPLADGTRPAEDPRTVTTSLLSASSPGAAPVMIGELRLICDATTTWSTAEQQVLNTFAATVAASLAHTRSYVEQVRTARVDSLTGLPNRLALREEVETLEPAFLDALAEHTGDGPPEAVAAVLLLDLDHFKEVNDTLGHEAGDRMLLVLAERLQQVLRAGDTVARLGGDEFAVLLHGVRNRGHAAAIAGSLLERLNEPVLVDGLELPVEASIGVAMAPGDATGLDGLLRCADVAMYAAKHKRNTVMLYDPSMDTASEERLHLLAELQTALKRGDLRSHYQPLVDLHTAEVVGVEALIRWQHPELGLLLPGRFVPAVEQTALIVPLTLDVLDGAVRDAVHWRHVTGRDLSLSVNISPRCLMVRDLPDRVVHALVAHGLPARCLTLEITETLALTDLEVVDTVLGRLRAIGVKLSVDDFGTGFSSMSFLRRIAVNEVKVDGGFVRAAPTSQEDKAIVQGTIALAHGLGLPVVGEGVETDEQLDLLLRAGADVAQGFALARPLPADEVPAVLMRRNATVLEAIARVDPKRTPSRPDPNVAVR